MAANIMSMIACWDFVITGNMPRLEAYYIYDIMLSAFNYDFLMVGHHTLVMYAIYRTDTPDYILGMAILRHAKFSDLFIYPFKLCQYFNNRITNFVKTASLALTIVLWGLFRISYILFVFNKIHYWEARVAASIFLGFTTWWTHKLLLILVDSTF
jgi:hypothetical protein